MKRWLHFGIAGALVLVLVLGLLAPVFASGLDELQDELDRIKQERERLEQDYESTENELSLLGLELEELNIELGQARYSLDMLNARIQDQEVLIDEQKQSIAEKELEIEETEQYLEEQVDCLEQRMVVMYKNGVVSYLEVLFDATSFSDFLSRLNFLQIIIESDSGLIHEVTEARDWLAAEKVELEEEMDLLVERMTQLEADQAAAQSEQRRISEMMASREQKQSNMQQALANMESEIGGAEEMEEELNREITRLLEEQRWQEGESPEGFVWPVPVTRYISSPFGWRTIYGRPDWHRGIDIAPGHIYWPGSPRYSGTPASIVAAAPGTVITAQYNASYGWYVLIGHGGGYATLYAHMHQRPMVAVGEEVSAGQQIGIVGSTGNSTGPHLHFEVRVDSQPVNPMDFHYN